MTFRKGSQIAAIANYLLAGNSITALEALGLFRAFRLAARIEQMRKVGMSIRTEILFDVTGKSYARYSLVIGSSRDMIRGPVYA